LVADFEDSLSKLELFLENGDKDKSLEVSVCMWSN
jgi:hypothetical protein